MKLDRDTPLFLDHLTRVDHAPCALIAAAAARGYAGICLFLTQMDALPRMPSFDLVTNRQDRRAVRDALAASGQKLGLAYPFTLTSRSALDMFKAGLDCAAELGADAVNLLVYDRDPQRRAEALAGFCSLAAAFGLRVALEFYPQSQIKSLSDAEALVVAVNQPGTLGLTIDLLHLVRSGGSMADVAALPKDMVFFAQLADGPAHRPEEDWAAEASTARAMLGEGDFDVPAFVAALPSQCRLSLEVPQPDTAQATLPHARDIIARFSAA